MHPVDSRLRVIPSAEVPKSVAGQVTVGHTDLGDHTDRVNTLVIGIMKTSSNSFAMPPPRTQHFGNWLFRLLIKAAVRNDFDICTRVFLLQDADRIVGTHLVAGRFFCSQYLVYHR